MSLKLTILGCNSAVPTLTRFTTSQVLSTSSKNYLIDCGEGVQIRINELKIKKSKIKEIFISHLHGDHFFGLPGFLTSLNLNGRVDPLVIYGPIGLKKFLSTLADIGSFYLNYDLQVNELDPTVKALIHEDSQIQVFTIPLKHRIPTTGFLFKEKKKLRNVISEKITAHELTVAEIKLAKLGEDIHRSQDKTILNSEITIEAPKTSSYAFCSDTIYDEDIIPMIKGSTLLYHEATYLHEFHDKARERGHATAKEAAIIAKKSGVEQLVLGHFSSRYKNLDPFIEEASAIFPRVSNAEDGKVFEF